MANFNQNCIGRWNWRRMDGDDFVNIMNPGTGNLSRVGWAGDDSELVDTNLGQGILIDGTKQQDGGAGAFCNFTVQNFSIEMWFHVTDFTVNRYMATKGGWAARGWWIVSDAGAGLMYLYTFAPAVDLTSFAYAGVLDRQLLHQMIVTKDGTRARIYVDGQEVTYAAVGVHDTLVSSAPDNLYIYSRAGATENLLGYGAQVRIWEGRVLGAADAKTLYIYGPNRT